MEMLLYVGVRVRELCETMYGDGLKVSGRVPTDDFAVESEIGERLRAVAATGISLAPAIPGKR